MTYHEFLAYLFDREPTRELAIAIASALKGRAGAQASDALN
jgi:hypothetical protein